MARRVSLPTAKKKDYTYEELYIEYTPHLIKSFYAMENDYHLAEDLAQETMYRVWQYWDRIQWDKLEGIIGTIANHTRFGYMRKFLNRVDTESYDIEEGIYEFECHDEGLSDPLRVLLLEQSLDETLKCVEKLCKKEKQMFVDAYIEGMDVHELMDKYKNTKVAIYVRLFRMRNKILNRLEYRGVDWKAWESFEVYD